MGSEIEPLSMWYGLQNYILLESSLIHIQNITQCLTKPDLLLRLKTGEAEC